MSKTFLFSFLLLSIFAGAKRLAEVEARLPKEVHWGKHSDGKSYLEPVMDQGNCGSCYAVSTMRMLSARHRIANQNAEKVTIKKKPQRK